ncbi:MAG: F0F1 ATP synthase subunit B [Flavobacteriales bacterium]|nr:F0F1 ATP synthase subunit B [Flavobacteriales bacterium]
MDGLLSVSWGTVFWATVAFLIVLYILKKYAWGPILKSLDERSQHIENALGEADRARQEMANLKSGNEELLREARNERDRILKDAKAVGEKVKIEIETKAREQSGRMIESALLEINNQKQRAITELKNQVATLSIEIAEKLVKEKLSEPEKQKALNSALAAELSAN